MHIVEKDFHNVTILNWLKRHFPSIGMSHFYKSIRKGMVNINGKSCKKSSYKLQCGDTIELPNHFLNKFETKITLSPEERSRANVIANNCIYEDDNMVIINKPKGLPSQGGRGISISVDSYVKEYGYYLAHRLDQGTSGIMIIAKSRTAAGYFFDLFKNKEIKKNYIAVVAKCQPLKDTYVSNSEEDYGSESVTINGQDDDSYALTVFNTIVSNDNISVVECSPQTGKKHQIRLHLAKGFNAPIIGDTLYGGTKSKRMMLHAYSVSFKTLEGKTLRFIADMDRDFLNFMLDQDIDIDSYNIS